jgi:hypothetical protein
MSTTKIKLDKDLVAQARAVAEAMGYSSVEEFITHTVESAVAQMAESTDSEELKEKLKGLGYIA